MCVCVCVCNFYQLTQAPEDACKVWWVTFSADISFQGNSYNAGANKFSVGFGLFIFAVIEIYVFLLFLLVQSEYDKEDSFDGDGEISGLVKCLRPPGFLVEREGDRSTPTSRSGGLSTCARL